MSTIFTECSKKACRVSMRQAGNGCFFVQFYDWYGGTRYSACKSVRPVRVRNSRSSAV